MKIYNTRALTRNQRFMNAVIAGSIAAILSGIILGFVLRIVPIAFDIFYLAVGYAVGYAIRNYGRGVQPRFSVLGAAMTFIALVIADSIRFVGLLGVINPASWIMVIGYYVTSLSSIPGIINLIFRICAIVLGYEQSRIV